jgi:hypothetical protein
MDRTTLQIDNQTLARFNEVKLMMSNLKHKRLNSTDVLNEMIDIVITTLSPKDAPKPEAPITISSVVLPKLTPVKKIAELVAEQQAMITKKPLP